MSAATTRSEHYWRQQECLNFYLAWTSTHTTTTNIQNHNWQLNIDECGKQGMCRSLEDDPWPASSLPGQHHEHGSVSNSSVGYTLRIWLRYQCHCTVLFMAHGQGYVPILTKWTRITGWSQTFCLLSTLSSSVKWAVKTWGHSGVT